MCTYRHMIIHRTIPITIYCKMWFFNFKIKKNKISGKTIGTHEHLASLSLYTSDVNLSVQSFLNKFLLLNFETFKHIIVCELFAAD